MVIEPKVRGYICTTAHPKGCSKNVREQIDYVKSQPTFSGPKRVLIIGCSTGYGLASRITAAYGCGAATLGIAFERAASGNRTATAGWYNAAAFEKYAQHDGLYAKSIIGDAFSLEIKQQAIQTIKAELGQVDLVIYSLAAPRRTTHEGVTYSSVLKPIGQDFSNKTIDMITHDITNVTVAAATEEEIEGTIKVMGGEDWQLWIQALLEADALSEGAVSLAYSYIGPKVTHAIYRDGTVGQAKKDLESRANLITDEMKKIGGRALVSVNKALVTQSSSAIPIVPLYITMLYKVMKGLGTHEGCIEQMSRMMATKLYKSGPITDEAGLIRMDDWELQEGVQANIDAAWKNIDNGNLDQYADLAGYWDDFYKLFGFGVHGVDYEEDVEADVRIPSIGE